MKKQSFIAEARREQIMEAAIQTLDEIGFAKASLAQIAKRADISTALISYHFSDKQDLMNFVLEKLMEQSSTIIINQVYEKEDPVEQLEIFILKSFQYQHDYPERNIALLEIIFHASTNDNIPYYRLEDGEEDVTTQALYNILKKGQQQGVFKNYSLKGMIDLIQGPIGEAMFHSFESQKALDTYSEDLISMIFAAIEN